MKRIGIIGFGFLGSAIAHGFNLHAQIKVYDKFKAGFNSLEVVIGESDFLFVCVPTPMRENGSQNIDQMVDAVAAIHGIAKKPKYIILKSTILPGTTRFFQDMCPQHHLIHNPEFLTQRVARLDFINQSRIILGGKPEPVKVVKNLYRDRFPATPIFETTWEGAEAVKYMANSFFALKVAFCNEMYDVAEKIGVPYEELRNMWIADGRVGNSHHEVPGHDGDRGYGGKCFPKDIEAFIIWQKEHGLHPFTLRGASETNSRVRKLKDWEEE